MSEITPQEIKTMPYVKVMAFLEETNRPPGGKDSIRRLVQNCFLNENSKVLDVGCNTGYCSFEIAHLVKCSIIGIDISDDMIRTADSIKQKDTLRHLIEFKRANATRLPFKDNYFDTVMSGGSTAFMEDKEKALCEYKRVTKPWGFIADINFFYNVSPPSKLINALNNLMEIHIQPWGINYWLNLYKNCGLEEYFIYTNEVKKVSPEKIEHYCSAMAKRKKISQEAKKALEERLIRIMTLFNENHKYLAYGVFILRKRPDKEQISLFGT